MLSDRDGEMVSNLRCVRKVKRIDLYGKSSVAEKTKWKNDIKKPGFLPLECKMDGVAIPPCVQLGKEL